MTICLQLEYVDKCKHTPPIQAVTVAWRDLGPFLISWTASNNCFTSRRKSKVNIKL